MLLRMLIFFQKKVHLAWSPELIVLAKLFALVKFFDPSEIWVPHLNMGKQCPPWGLFWGLNNRHESTGMEKVLKK